MQRYGDGAYYLSRSIAMADAAYASCLPPSATEWAIYEQRLRRLGQALHRSDRLDLTVAPALQRSELPYLKNLPVADVLSARRDDEHFEAWRSSLRTVSREISSLPSEGEAFASEAHDILKDGLSEAASEVRDATSRSAALRRNLRPNALTLTTGAAGITGAAAVVGGSTSAVGALTLTGMLRYLADSLLAPSLTGTKAVLASLVHDRPDTAADAEWPKREPLVITPKRPLR